MGHHSKTAERIYKPTLLANCVRLQLQVNGIRYDKRLNLHSQYRAFLKSLGRGGGGKKRRAKKFYWGKFYQKRKIQS